jgi:transposase
MSSTGIGEQTVGIDVSQERLDVCIRTTRESFSVGNDKEGRGSLAQRLAGLKPRIVVMESTGGMELPMALELQERGVPFRIVNARQVRDFAKAKGILAKTDRIDALVLALFAHAMEVEPKALPDAARRALRSLVMRRMQLIEAKVAEQNRLHAELVVRVRKSIEKSIAWLTREIATLDKELDRTIRNNPEFAAVRALAIEVPGVGESTVRMLIACLPELGTLSRQKISALTGIAPLNKDSGKSQGKRYCWGGRSEVRSALYMAALVGTRFNPLLRALYERLRATGKAAKVAIVACMRKLLVILNAMVRDNTQWRQTSTAAVA